MWNNTRLTQLIGLKYPIVQAPMAGGATPPELYPSEMKMRDQDIVNV